MRTAILVQPDFGAKNFSIRSYVATVKNAMEAEGDVEYITYQRHRQGICWYRVAEVRKDTIETLQIRGNMSEIRRFLIRLIRKKEEQLITAERYYYFQYIGTDLKQERYDLCIIADPCAVSPDIKISAGGIIGLVYDFFPNDSIVLNRGDPIFYGNVHHAGYLLYNEICDKIIAISRVVMEQYEAIYAQVKKERLTYLPPIIPTPYQNVIVSGEREKREQALVLAAPFNLRKGMRKLPAILNEVSDHVERIYIFGMPCCGEKDIRAFFDKLTVTAEIIYYPRISFDDQIALYKKCKVLLFPSIEEGLGLPIIEAQVCGCRVATTDARPMNELIIGGGYHLTGDEQRDGVAIGEMLVREYPYEKISKLAKECYACCDGIRDILLNRSH